MPAANRWAGWLPATMMVGTFAGAYAPAFGLPVIGIAGIALLVSSSLLAMVLVGRALRRGSRSHPFRPIQLVVCGALAASAGVVHWYLYLTQGFVLNERGPDKWRISLFLLAVVLWALAAMLRRQGKVALARTA